MRRLFWFGLGVAAGVFASRKVTGTAQQLTPAGIAENMGTALKEVAGALGAFGADVRAGMAEREVELTEHVEQPLGSRSRRANRTRRSTEQSSWSTTPDVADSPGRARRAEG